MILCTAWQAVRAIILHEALSVPLHSQTLKPAKAVAHEMKYLRRQL